MLVPLNDYILLEAITGEEETESGLIVSNSKGDKIDPVAGRGRVISIPEDLKSGFAEVSDTKMERRRVDIQVGDIVYYAKWEVHMVKHKGVDYIQAKYQFILSKVEDEG